MAAPTSSNAFDSAYRAPLTLWGDVRIPQEIREFAAGAMGRSVLELGCGIGRLARFMAQQGLHTTGLDFSAVAIARARQRVARDALKPEFLQADVTCLDALRGPFDAAYDVGCFHCLEPRAQQAYVAELTRLLKVGGTHLIWAMDGAPSDIPLSPQTLAKIFMPGFQLRDARASRRRFTRSHWYWLTRA